MTTVRSQSTRTLRANLHERLAGTQGVHELAELERRIMDMLAAHEKGECSADDIAAHLYVSGWGDDR